MSREQLVATSAAVKVDKRRRSNQGLNGPCPVLGFFFKAWEMKAKNGWDLGLFVFFKSRKSALEQSLAQECFQIFTELLHRLGARIWGQLKRSEFHRCW